MSSAWRSTPVDDPRHSRSRSLLPGYSSSDNSDVNQNIPQWLIAEQRQFVRSAGKLTPPPKSNPIHRSRNADSRSANQRQRNPPPQDDDLIIVDLLEGAHVATKPTAPQTSATSKPPQMTSNSYSIISLPPMNSASTPQWNAPNSASHLERRHRAGASVGSVPPPHLPSSVPAAPIYMPLAPQPPQKPPCNPYPSSIDTDPLPAIAPPITAAPSRPDHSPAHHHTRRHHRQRSGAIVPQEHLDSFSPSETMPMLADTSSRNVHARRNSFMTGSFWDEEFNFSVSTRSSERSKPHAKKKHRGPHRDPFEPGVWGWRKPAEEDAIMPKGAWIYLALIGFCTFLIAWIISTSARFLSVSIISALAGSFGNRFGDRAGIIALATLRGFSLATSFVLVTTIAPYYSAGSGIPEMKCVLSGVLLRKMLNWRTLVSKSVGLIFSLSSGISIGRLGPFIHISGITAALVSKIPWFTSLRSSARFQLQALSAAMAAGVGATFGAPIGGAMLSIEVMSTYYYIHWLPMALYCSIMGYYFVIAFVQPDSSAFFTSNVKLHLKTESLQRLITYVILGALSGLLGAALVEFTKMAFQFKRYYFKNQNRATTTLMVALFAMMHTFVSVWVGGVLAVGQKEGVTQLFNKSAGKDLWLTDIWEPFSLDHYNTCFALLVATAVKFVLTGLSLVMPVPAGTFMPIFEIGALFGRAFGEFFCGIWFVNWVDVRATAIIGAAAVTAGTLHTTSVAVVMLELTREAIDVLPLAVGVIVSYGVSKQICSDLFSELIKLRRLPFILGLRERYPSENRQFFEDAASVTAGSVMTKDFPFVTPESTKGEVYKLLTQGGKPWITCAFLSDREERRLWGTISQKTLWDAVGDNFVPYLQSGDEESAYGTFEGDFRREHELIPFLRTFDPSVGHEHVDMGPMQISVHTPFWRIITYFRMLSMNTMYVVQDGITVGSVSRVQVIHYSIYLEERAKRKREQEAEIRERREREERLLLEHFRRNPLGRMASRPSRSDLHSHIRRGRKKPTK